MNPTAASSSVASPSNPPEAPAANEPAKKHHLFLPMVSRRSSKASKTDKQSASEKTEDPEQREPARRGSKGSILKVRRDRSRASSRRSRRGTQDVSNAEKPQESAADTATPTTPDMNGLPPPQKKRGLFGFLTCCSSGVDGDDEPPIPPKTTTKEPAPIRQATPDKSEVNAGDSSTAESKDPAYYDEKSNAPLNGDPSPSQKAPSTSEAQPEGQSAGTKPDNVNEIEEKSGSTAVNGLATESKSDALSPEDQTGAPEPTPTDATSKKLEAEAADTPSHEEDEVIQSPPVLPLPPPPPLPVPDPPAVSDRDDGQWLLPAPLPHLKGRKCLVLDLDETLVHSSFKVFCPFQFYTVSLINCSSQVLERADFTIPVEIEGQYHNIYVIKRPGVDQFMKRVGELYEVVVFTASVSKVSYTL